MLALFFARNNFPKLLSLKYFLWEVRKEWIPALIKCREEQGKKYFGLALVVNKGFCLNFWKDGNIPSSRRRAGSAGLVEWRTNPCPVQGNVLISQREKNWVIQPSRWPLGRLSVRPAGRVALEQHCGNVHCLGQQWNDGVVWCFLEQGSRVCLPGGGDSWCEWHMVSAKTLLLPMLDIPSTWTSHLQAPVLLPWPVTPPWLLQSSFLWWKHSPAPSLSRVLHVQIWWSGLALQLEIIPKMPPPKHWACALQSFLARRVSFGEFWRIYWVLCWLQHFSMSLALSGNAQVLTVGL